MVQSIQLNTLDKNTAVFIGQYNVSLAKIWQAISTDEGLAKWFMKSKMDVEVGGVFQFEGGWEGWIAALKELEYIQFNSSEVSYTRFELRPTTVGVELRLVDKLPPAIEAQGDSDIQNFQPNGKGTHWVGLLAGWHDFLLALESYLAKKEIADNYKELCDVYKDLLDKQRQKI
ncbi:MAG: SRPBCC domain-containing protein [Flavipsychrobacter sp.]